MDKEIQKDERNGGIQEPKKNPLDPRKNPRPGYDEQKPTKEDIQEHPEDQHSGKSH